MLEMALVLPLVFTTVMGCLELGLAFNAYLTVISAAREGARAGALYLYNSNFSRAANDQNRESGTGTSVPYTGNIRDTVVASLGILKGTPPAFDKNSDVTVTYYPPDSQMETRSGDLVTVQVVYRYRPISNVLLNGSTITMTARASARIE